MKNLYGIMGFAGFMIMLGGAGGAETVSFGEAVGVMATGLVMLLLSLVLVKSHNMRMRKRRYLLMKKKRASVHRKECIASERKVPVGIKELICT